MRKLTVVLTVAFGLAALSIIGCSGGGEAGVAQPVVNTTDGNNGVEDNGSGVSSVPDIKVVDGKILVKVENGIISINGENLTLTHLVGDEWVLIDDINITLKDQYGNLIPGNVLVDPVTGYISFIPEDGLEVEKIYNLTVTVDGKKYTATVIIAVDNTSEDNSMFADVAVYDSVGEYYLSDLIVNGKAIWGWEFPPRFSIALTGMDKEDNVFLTFYGVYDVDGYRDMVFFQRWESGFKFKDYDVSAGDPVKDFPWYGPSGLNGAIKVNEIDSSIDDPGGNQDYSFWRTYAEIKIIRNGENITETSEAKVVITGY